MFDDKTSILSMYSSVQNITGSKAQIKYQTSNANVNIAKTKLVTKIYLHTRKDY
jgi:hypothetical protein